MKIFFKVLALKERPSSKLGGVVQLVPGDWDDYSFKTSFRAVLYRLNEQEIDLGVVKIGYQSQPKGWTLSNIPQTFERLPGDWFALGQDVDYYRTLVTELSIDERLEILEGLRDVVANESVLTMAHEEPVFKDSLMRNVSLSIIRGQFQRVLQGEAELSDFKFVYAQDRDDRHAPVELHFSVEASSKPSTNVHVLIGRNGVGKTTLLNNMVGALLGLTRPDQPSSQFLAPHTLGGKQPLSKLYFSSVVSVSFSAFDPFLPPIDRQDRTLGPAYFYIGMKNSRSGGRDSQRLPPKAEADLVNDFIKGFQSCISQPAKRARWAKAIERLESDANFEDMDLRHLLELDDKEAVKKAGALAGRMSSGHSIVLLTITKLVDTVDEKTLVLLDEPESHLHPPLLSAFTRALSELLHSRNGVAIVATHSPVVLQEVPRSCVWKLTRLRLEGRSDRPERETFGENVGILTREIFGLEVAKAGFHEVLERAVDAGGTYENIWTQYAGQLGAEAQAILLSLIAARDASSGRA